MGKGGGLELVFPRKWEVGEIGKKLYNIA